MIIGVDHVAIQASDFEVALHFYHELLGFPVVQPAAQYKTRTLCYLSAGNILIELYSAKSDGPPAIPYVANRGGLDHLSFRTRDLDAAIEALSGKGVKVIKKPFEVQAADGHPQRLAFIEGPDGQEIELRQATE